MKTRPIPSLSVMFSDLVSSPLWECKMITWWRNASPKEIEEDVGIGKLAGTYFSDTALAWNKMKDSEDEDCGTPRPNIRVIMADANPRPIETAPRDGTRLLLFIDEGWEFGRWNDEREVWQDFSFYALFPTHWLPLPPSPNLS